MSKQVKVICIEEGGGGLVPSSKIESVINQILSQGWSFVQISTGGISYSDGNIVNTWVYILFER